MAKGIYVGVAGVARKVKKIYVGVAGVARKCKKIYVGVAGVARLVYILGLTKFTVTSLSGARAQEAGSGNPNTKHILFGGGIDTNGTVNTVEGYNENYVKSALTGLYFAMTQSDGGYVGNYNIFAGGYNNYYQCYYNVAAYDASMVYSEPFPLAPARRNSGVANVGNYVMFAGGDYYDSGWLYTNYVTTYDTNLTRSGFNYDTTDPRSFGGASIPGYAILKQTYRSVSAYNSSLVKTALAAPTILNYDSHNASAGCSKYALFGHGQDYTMAQTAVDLYDINLVHTTAYLPSARRFCTAVGLDDYVIVAGGQDVNNSNPATVFIFDTSGVVDSTKSLSAGALEVSGAAAGDRALFSSGGSAIVDVFAA